MQPSLRPMQPREAQGALGEAFSAQAMVGPMRKLAAKDLPLEAIRGLAAISVVSWHAMLGFFPEKSGHFPEFADSGSLAGEAWFGLVHGTAAVTLFFVLSGYVLSRRYFETRDGGILLRGILKRWPRLAGPVLLVAMASWALFALQAYGHIEAAKITKSPWLAHFGCLSTKPFTPGFFDALKQGLFTTFFNGESYYDSSLWTMRYEFGGSFIVFGAARTLGLFRELHKCVAAGALGVLVTFLNFNGPAYAPFVIGVGLAYFLPRPGADRKQASPAAAVAITLAIYMFGFSGRSVGVYAAVPEAFAGAASTFHIVASLLLISAVEHGPLGLRRVLSGRVSAFLGVLSFPIYLVHVLVLCSAGAAALLWADTAGWSENAARSFAVTVTLSVSALVALPLVVFNERWVGVVNRFVAGLVAKPASSTPACSDGLHDPVA